MILYGNVFTVALLFRMAIVRKKCIYLTSVFLIAIAFIYSQTSLLTRSVTLPELNEFFALDSHLNESFEETTVAVSIEDDGPVSDQTKTESKFEYPDSLTRFPLSPWLDELMKSQPVATHNATLADPNEKFIVMTCHKFKNVHYEECGGFTDRLFLLPYYLWLANKTGRKLLM